MSADDPDDLRGEFLKYMAAFHEREERSLFDVLPEMGVSLPSPEQLDDEALGRKMWEVIHALSLAGAYLHNTDHLSDRQLYAQLWQEILREPVVLMPERSDYAYHIDMIGSGSEEDIFLYLKYYAGEKERRSWLEDWPSDPLPDAEKPPYSRDCNLPRAELRRDDGPAN